MLRLALAALFILSLVIPAAAQVTGCTTAAAISQSASTKLVSGSPNNRVYVCALILSNSNAAVQTLQLVEGTGTNCATGQTVLLNIALGANGTGTFAAPFPFPWVNTLIAGDDLCLLGGAATISGGFTFRQQP